MRSHSVTCHPAEVTFPPLPQPKLVLDLATPDGCKAECYCLSLRWKLKAELTWVVVISQDSSPAKYRNRISVMAAPSLCMLMMCVAVTISLVNVLYFQLHH